MSLHFPRNVEKYKWEINTNFHIGMRYFYPDSYGTTFVWQNFHIDPKYMYVYVCKLHNKNRPSNFLSKPKFPFNVKSLTLCECYWIFKDVVEFVPDKW